MGEFFFKAGVVVLILTVAGALYRPFKAAAMLMEAKSRYWQARAALEEHRLYCLKKDLQKGGGA